MANSKFSAYQTVMRSSLARVVSGAGVALNTILTALDSEITPPGAITPSSPASRIVTIGAFFVINPTTSIRHSASPLAGLLPTFTGSTVTLDATGVGNATPGVGSALALGMIANQFMRLGININSSGSIVLTKGTPAASLVAAGVPSIPSNTLATGYIVVRTDGSNNVQNVLGSDVYQYSGTAMNDGSITNPLLDGFVITGQSDEVQLQVTAFSTQTSLIASFTNSFSRNALSLSNGAVLTIGNTTDGGDLVFTRTMARTGSAANPSYSFVGDASNGIYSDVVSTMGFATSGVFRFGISNDGVYALAGTVAKPSYAFVGDSSTGFYSTAATNINAATNGVLRLTINNTAVTTTGPLVAGTTLSASGRISTSYANAGNAAELTITNTDTGTNSHSIVNLSNGTRSLFMRYASTTGFNGGGDITGGLTGEVGEIYTSGTNALVLGTNSTLAYVIDGTTQRSTIGPAGGLGTSNAYHIANAAILSRVTSASTAGSISSPTIIRVGANYYRDAAGAGRAVGAFTGAAYAEVFNNAAGAIFTIANTTAAYAANDLVTGETERFVVYASGISSTPGQSGFSVYKNADQTGITGTDTIVQFEVERWDNRSEFDLTAETFTIQRSGFYQFNTMLNVSSVGGNLITAAAYIYINGVQNERAATYACDTGTTSTAGRLCGSVVVPLTIGDVVTLRASANLSAGSMTVGSGINNTSFNCIKVA